MIATCICSRQSLAEEVIRTRQRGSQPMAFSGIEDSGVQTKGRGINMIDGLGQSVSKLVC